MEQSTLSTRDYYEVLDVPRDADERRSRLRSIGWLGATTPIGRPSLTPRSDSRRSPRPTRCSPTRPSGPTTTPAGPPLRPG